MTKATGVFLPDESEQQLSKKPPRSVHVNARGSAGAEPAKTDYSELGKLGEHELKAAIKSEWKKHEESARADLAPLLYFLRERLRAQGARNDLSDVERDRGFGAWVEENLDISRRTADRWCDWFAVEAGLKENSTSGHVSKSDVDLWDGIQNEHEGQQQIAFNCWVESAVHAQFHRALARLQKQFGLKNKKEAMVKGVIYAATALNREAKGGRSSGVVGHVSLWKRVAKTKGHSGIRATVRPAHRRGTQSGSIPVVARGQGKGRHQPMAHGSDRHRGGSSLKAAKAAAGR
jgi:hypothetical protein